MARRCFEPHAVFREVERRAACRGFTAARIAAEARLYGTPYTLDDIYRQLAQDTTTDTATIRQLRDRELAVEREMLFPIAEHCASFATGDIVVSDMYLPGEFLHEIVTQTCRLSPSWLFVAAEGKRNGRIWPTVREHCTPVEHLGDNEVTDLQSASLAGIPARLTTIAQRTAIETDLAAAGYEPLANLIREARLRTWSPVDAERQIQLLQTQTNFPLLFVATLLLAELAAQRGWRRILFSGRDCYLWHELYRALEPLLGATPAATYFYTSRIARTHPSPDYITYFQSLYAGEPSALVDLCGTGWSANRLLAHASGTRPDIFLLHHLDQPNIRNYYERNAAVTEPIAPLCCLHRGIINQENEVLEELNRAPHPLVTDVVATRTGFQPVFMQEPAPTSTEAALRWHRTAFHTAVTLLPTLRLDQVSSMRRADHSAAIARIYRDMQGQLNHVAHFWPQKTHEEQIFQQFIEQRGATGGVSKHFSTTAPVA